MSEISKIHTNINNLENNDNLDDFRSNFDIFTSNLMAWNILKSEGYIKSIFNIQDLNKLTTLNLNNKLEKIFSDFSFFDKPVLFVYWDDLKADILYKIWELFEKKWNNKKALEFFYFASKIVEKEDLKNDILHDIKVIKSRLKNDIEEKEDDTLDKLFSKLKSLQNNITNLQPILESDYEKNKFDKNNELSEKNKLKNSELLENQKQLLKSLWIDISDINNNWDLLKKISVLVKKYEEDIFIIDEKVKEIKKEKNIVYSKIGDIDKKIVKIKTELKTKVKNLEKKIKEDIKIRKEKFTETNYFKWDDKNIKENIWIWRNEDIWKNYDVSNWWKEHFGFWETNEIEYNKLNFFIDWIEKNHTIPEQIKLWYSDSINSNSNKYIWKLNNLYNDTNKEIKVNYYEELSSWTKTHKIAVPSWYKVSTNNINFSNKKVSYNIVIWDMWMTYLLFEPKLEEKTKIKIWLVKDKVRSTKNINILFNKVEIWKSLNTKNKTFLDNINIDLPIFEKVQLVKEHILKTSYYVAWWIELPKFWEGIVEKVENNYSKNWKRPLICNLANNQFSAYLNYLGIKSAYITWPSSWWYSEYMWHWWVKYFDWNTWIKTDATPSPDSESDLEINFSNSDISKIKKEERKAESKINKENINKKPLLEENTKLQKDIDKNNNEKSWIQDKILKLENILSPEKKDNIETTIKNSDTFEKVMKDFWITFLKNLQNLKKEQIALEPQSKSNWKIVMYDWKILDKDNQIKLKKFNKKLDSFLRNTVSILTSALNNENIDFWTQYSYLILLTSLLNNFRDKIFYIDSNLSKKLDIIKAKIKNESLFLDEIKSFPKLSYIKIWDNLLMKKWKFDFEIINLNNMKFVFKNWKEEHIWVYEKWDIEKYYFLWENWIKEIKVNYWYYMSKDWRIITEHSNNNFIKRGLKVEDSINNKFIKFWPINKVNKNGNKIWWLINYIYFDTFNIEFHFDSNQWEFKNFKESVWDNNLLFFDNFKRELVIKDNNLNIVETFNDVNEYMVDWDYLIIRKNWKVKEYFSENMKYVSDRNTQLYKVTKKWIEKKETAFLFGEELSLELFMTIKEYLFFEKDFIWNSNIHLKDKRIQFVKNMKNIRNIFKPYNIRPQDTINIWDIIEWEDWFKYIKITANNIFYTFRNDWKMIFKRINDDNYSLQKVDKNWNVFIHTSPLWNEIIWNDWKNYRHNFDYNIKKVSFYDNLDWNKIEYQANYTEIEYIKEFSNLLKRKSIEIFDENDIDFVINRMSDFKLDSDLQKIYEEVLSKN